MTEAELSAPDPLSAEQQHHRDRALARLEGLVEFVALRDNTKIPATRFSKAENRSITPPTCQNVGAYPINRTVIFDFDVKGNLSAAEQIELLEKHFSLPLQRSFMVETPSTGIHVYTLWPEDVPLPGNKKLQDLGLGVEGDIRAAGRVGQCVFPGSSIRGRMYQVLRDAPVLELTIEQAEKVVNAFPKKTRRAASPKKTVSRKAGAAPREPKVLTTETADAVVLPVQRQEVIASENALPRDGVPVPLDLKKLEWLQNMLQRKSHSTYVTRRAAVYNVLSCCEDGDTIIEYWRALAVDKDTSKHERRISTFYLRRELSRLTPSNRHSMLCSPGGSERLQEPTLGYVSTGRGVPGEKLSQRPLDPSEKIARSVDRLRTPRGYRKPTIIDMPRAYKALQSRQKPGKGYELSLFILEDFIQPWYNLGVERIMLAENYLASFYGSEVEEIRAAKRLLLRREILQVAVKQAPGRTTVFRVPRKFREQELSLKLAYTRRKCGEEIVLAPRSNLLISARTGEVHGNLVLWEKYDWDEWPPRGQRHLPADYLLRKTSEALVA